MSRASEAYALLSRAMEDAAIPCKGDERFVADGYLTQELALICHGCPIIAPCRDYAAAAKPAAGVWAGRRWNGDNRVHA